MAQIVRSQPDERRVKILRSADYHLEPTVAMGRLLEVVDAVSEQETVLILALARASDLEREEVRESAVMNEVADPWPTQQLAAVIRRMGNAAGELATLEEYVVDCGVRDVPDSIVGKISKGSDSSESRR